jgi:hypothetical protein
VHRLPLVRVPRPRPPSNCTSSEIGKSCLSPMLAADCDATMMPLLRIAQLLPAPAPVTCCPRKRYSTATM